MTVKIIDATTVERVRFEVELVRRVSSHDPEYAHSLEDMLFKSVLVSIMTGTGDDPKDLAREALKTLEIQFPRWTA